MTFEIKLKTPRTTTKGSQLPGDVVTVENDEAWFMIDRDHGSLVGKKAPEKPASVLAEEKAAKEAAAAAKKAETEKAEK
jgi:hypothetical protein